jgi:nucleotide-binding universal stress UspA family protein
MQRSILHPTDFSDLSSAAFAHALCVALATRSRLHILHVAQHGTGGGALAFPHARRLLVQWGLASEDDAPRDLAQKLGIEVDHVRVNAQAPVQGVVNFLQHNTCDLIVLATRGGGGFERWLTGSVAENISRRSLAPTLFIAGGARGFVSQVSGDVHLRRALVPIHFSPTPDRAIKLVQRLGRLLAGTDILVHLLHVGEAAPPLRASQSSSLLPSVILRSGNVVNAILDAATEFEVDLIGMPTAGHQGMLDALRGTTTERVIRHAPCPVLAVPSP